MTLGNEILTAGAIVGPMAAILWFFFRKWMERMERMEIKLDALMEMKSFFITREEFEKSVNRIHQRMDEHIAAEQELSSRLACCEGHIGRETRGGKKP